MSVVSWNEQKCVYLANSLGELTGNKEVSETTYEWYEKNCLDNEWLQYLVEMKDEIGILAIHEFPHPEGDDWDSDKHYYSEAWKQSTNKEIWEHLENLAQKIDREIDFNVMLGKETGFMARHELGIWFPFGTNKKTIEQSFQKIQDIQLLY